MKASDLFVKCLENEGAEYIFGVPGDENLDLLESLSRSDIKFILTRHEQGAAFMADVYGRLTGKPGICLSTLGPGATNLMTGVADAYLDRAPLVAITGQAELEKTHKESHQYINVSQTFKSVTVWNKTITKARFIPEIVKKAFNIATETPGSTHIELPEDVAQEEVDAEPLREITWHYHDVPKLEGVLKAAELIKKSQYPIILAGNGVIRFNASKELLNFAKNNDISVATTFMGKGAISDREKLHLGTIGLQAKDFLMCGFERADLVITIGYDQVEYAPSFWNLKKDKKIIHLDTKHPEIDEYYITNVDLIGDTKEGLKLLTEHTGFKKNIDYSFKLREYMENELNTYRKDDSFPMKPQRMILDIRASLDDDDVLICDVGAHKMWIARLYPTYKPNTVIISNGFSSMGIALPGAIAAKLVYPEKNVIAATGDGGFLMNVQELETAKRLDQDFVVVIFNDAKYGLVEWNQKVKFEHAFGVDFTNPDFVKLAESFGVNGVKIAEGGELEKTIKDAIKEGGIWLIDAEVDYSENMRLTERLGKSVCPV